MSLSVRSASGVLLLLGAVVVLHFYFVNSPSNAQAIIARQFNAAVPGPVQVQEIANASVLNPPPSPPPCPSPPEREEARPYQPEPSPAAPSLPISNSSCLIADHLTYLFQDVVIAPSHYVMWMSPSDSESARSCMQIKQGALTIQVLPGSPGAAGLAARHVQPLPQGAQITALDGLSVVINCWKTTGNPTHQLYGLSQLTLLAAKLSSRQVSQYLGGQQPKWIVTIGCSYTSYNDLTSYTRNSMFEAASLLLPERHWSLVDVPYEHNAKDSNFQNNLLRLEKMVTFPFYEALTPLAGGIVTSSWRQQAHLQPLPELLASLPPPCERLRVGIFQRVEGSALRRFVNLEQVRNLLRLRYKKHAGQAAASQQQEAPSAVFQGLNASAAGQNTTFATSLRRRAASSAERVSILVAMPAPAPEDVFVITTHSHMSVREQIGLLDNFDIIVGPHGSHVVMMLPTRISIYVEIMGPIHNPVCRNLFSATAKRVCMLSFGHQLVGPVKPAWQADNATMEQLCPEHFPPLYRAINASERERLIPVMPRDQWPQKCKVDEKKLIQQDLLVDLLRLRIAMEVAEREYELRYNCSLTEHINEWPQG